MKILAALVLAFSAGVLVSSDPAIAAFGFCSRPSAPSAYLAKPSKPYCVISRSCSQWDVQNYRNEIDRYFDGLKRYAGDVDAYYSDAQNYIKCMADLD